jgi:hypothetical protein
MEIMHKSTLQLIMQLRQFPYQLEQHVACLPYKQLTHTCSHIKMNIAQHVHHLADAHMTIYIHSRLIYTENEPPLKPYDESDWLRCNDCASADITASLAILRGTHGRMAEFFSTLTPSDWERAGNHPVNGYSTLHNQLELLVAHGQAHLAQIITQINDLSLQLPVNNRLQEQEIMDVLRVTS